MPPIGFDKEPPTEYEPNHTPKKVKKNKKHKYSKPGGAVPDYDDYFEPYTQPHKPHKVSFSYGIYRVVE